MLYGGHCDKHDPCTAVKVFFLLLLYPEALCGNRGIKPSITGRIQFWEQSRLRGDVLVQAVWQVASEVSNARWCLLFGFWHEWVAPLNLYAAGKLHSLLLHLSNSRWRKGRKKRQVWGARSCHTKSWSYINLSWRWESASKASKHCSCIAVKLIILSFYCDCDKCDKMWLGSPALS